MGKAKRELKRLERAERKLSLRMSDRPIRSIDRIRESEIVSRPLRGPDGWMACEDVTRWDCDQRVRDAMGFESVRLKAHLRMAALLRDLMSIIGDMKICVMAMNANIVDETDSKAFALHFENFRNGINRNDAIEFFIGLDPVVDFYGVEMKCRFGSPILDVAKKCEKAGLIRDVEKNLHAEPLRKLAVILT